jgi:hypothetical protein
MIATPLDREALRRKSAPLLLCERARAAPDSPTFRAKHLGLYRERTRCGYARLMAHAAKAFASLGLLLALVDRKRRGAGNVHGPIDRLSPLANLGRRREPFACARGAATPFCDDLLMFSCIRRRQRLTTAKSRADNPLMALRSAASAAGMTRSRTARPLAVSRTMTSRLLFAERVRVTRPMFASRVAARDRVDTSMLVLVATSIWRCAPSFDSTANARHIAIFKRSRASGPWTKSRASAHPTRFIR